MQVDDSKWKSLPVEILQEILELADFFMREEDYYGHQQYARNFALVCKSWVPSAQSVLYSNISIQTLRHFARFYKAVKSNPYLGEKVKRLHLQFGIPRTRGNEVEREKKIGKFLDILSKLLFFYIPNLQELKEDYLESYVPVLNALMNSELKQLTRLTAPKRGVERMEIPNYTTCVILMKERVKKIVIQDDLVTARTINEKVYFNHLYEKLYQFDKLGEVDICKKTNEGIQIIQNVLHCCKYLKKLEFKFTAFRSENKNFVLDSITPVDTISSLAPSYSLQSLKGDVMVTSDYKMLLYLMHKFPKLQSLSLTTNNNGPARLHQHIITRLLKFFSGIDVVSVSQLRVDNHNISETISNYWDSVSKPGIECLELVYTGALTPQDTYVLDITKSKNKIGSTFSFLYPARNQDSHYVNILEKTGKYIGELRLKFEAKGSHGSPIRELPEKFLDYAFTYCPNLQTLYFDSCDLKRPSPSGLDQKLSINELRIKGCDLSYDFLNELSVLLSQVNVLRIGDTKYRSEENQSSESNYSSDKAALRICMPYTEISSIYFERLSYRTTYHLKVFTSQEDYCYYRFDESLEVSNEQEYSNAKAYDRFYVHCQTKPNFRFKRGGYFNY